MTSIRTYSSTIVALSLASLLALSACVDPYADPYASSQNPNLHAQQGVVLGGVLGAVTGTIVDNGGLGGALLGGAVGATAGGLIGNRLDAQAAALRQSIGNNSVSVTNHGTYLQVNIPDGLLFDTNSASLKSPQMSELRGIAQNLRQYRDSQIVVVGHTDNTGPAEFNQSLSQRRAETVAFALENGGVSSSRIHTVGRGEDQPIASNLTAQGRAQNRRVEIIIRPN